MPKKKVLIIGGAGNTARPIIDLLVDDYAITVFDIIPYAAGHRSPTAHVRMMPGDICDIAALQNAMAGMDVVIHLAVNTANTQDGELSFKVNVFGTFNVLQAAKQMEVKKVIMASSAAVHMDPSAGAACSPGEDFTYDLTKNLQELQAFHFAKTYAMNIMVLRLGHIVNGKAQTDLHGTPLSETDYCKGGWVCRHDVASAFKKSVEVDFEGYQLLHIIGSCQAKDTFDVSAAANMLGFECLEQFLDY